MIIILILFLVIAKPAFAEAMAGEPVMANEFPMGSYIAYPTEVDLPKMRAAGLNLYVGDADLFNADAAVSFLDMVYRNHMQVILSVAPAVWHPEYYPNFADFIRKIKNHPALYGYYLSDEPEMYGSPTVAKMTQINNLIKQADPNHPTIVVFSAYLDDGQYNAKRYFGIADVEGFDVYPFSKSATDTTSSLSFYYQTVDKFLALHNNLAVNNTKAYFILLQSFASDIRREPTETELNQFIVNTFNKSNLFSGYLYYAWRTNTEDLDQTASELPSLQTSMTRINEMFKNRSSIYPVVYKRIGDANGDGKVDLIDFAEWRKEYLNGNADKADFKPDGKVDLFDFAEWRKGYLNI